MLAEVSRAISSGAWWAPLLAFGAGVVSFASPCVLPLVPGYLLMVTGEEASAGGSGRGRARAAGLLPVALFILGFSVVFMLLGGFARTALSSWLRSDAGQRVAGLFVVAFGLFMLAYAFRARLPWLYREGRPLLSRVRPGPAGAFPLGMAFAVGWTPCIGPVLGAILTLAAAQGSAGRASFLLFVYSLGLGIPFLLIGAGVTRLLGTFRFFSRHYRAVAAVSGFLLVTLGVLLVSGLWVRLLSPVLRAVNRYTPPI